MKSLLQNISDRLGWKTGRRAGDLTPCSHASAYLSIFDDWELLAESLASIDPYVDEIVVVDGAYRWLADLVRREGRDPSRSLPQVYEKLEPFGTKIRVIPGIWDNELQKRLAGYDGCSHRHIYRVDADEILFFNESAYSAFFLSDKAVAEMEMPVYVAPGIIRATRSSSRIERQALLFDREKITAADHLGYLWLVLPESEDAVRSRADAAAIFPEPIAFNAHLTHWRPPATALNRARFYVLNYVRRGGDVPWLAPSPVEGEDALVDRLRDTDPALISDILLGHDIVAGPLPMEGFVLQRSPLTSLQEKRFEHLYRQFLDGLAHNNQSLMKAKRTLAAGNDYYLDLSTPAAVAPFQVGDQFKIIFDKAIAGCRAVLISLTGERGFVTTYITPEVGTDAFSFPTSKLPPALRTHLRFTVWNADGSLLNAFGAPIVASRTNGAGTQSPSRRRTRMRSALSTL